MTPSSITIRIDFGSDGGASSGGSSVAVSGGIPTPLGSSMSASGEAALSGGVPTPFDNAGPILGAVDTSAPAPSPTLVPAGAAASAAGGVGGDEVPTPFSSGGAPRFAGSADTMPTPFDSAHVAGQGDKAPIPQGAATADASSTRSLPPGPDDGPPRKRKK